MSTPPASVPDFEELRRLLVRATQQLLGDTADLAEPDWRRPSGLPGWSRAHVASHLARHAEASAEFIDRQLAGRPQLLYPSREARDAAIEAGATRSGVALQTDLDQAAAALEQALDGLPPGERDRVVTVREGLTVPLGLLPLVRLSEVVLHHVDLRVGVDCRDLAPAAALAVLEFYHGVRLAGREDYPAMTLVPTQAPERELVMGPPGEDGPRLQQDAATLLGLLTRRLEPAEVPGAEQLRLPALG